jgi:uncharacterized protein (DUF2062 family)
MENTNDMQKQEKQKSLFARVRRFIKFRIIHVDDSPHRIALGVSLGLFTAFLPLLGLHTFIAFALSFVARANKAVAILCSWISNPLTVIPIFVPSYLFGRSVVGIFREPLPADTDQVAEILERAFSFSGLAAALSSSDFWKEMASLFGKIGLELTTGCLILGVTFALVFYFITYKMIIVHRKKVARKHKNKDRHKGTQAEGTKI